MPQLNFNVDSCFISDGRRRGGRAGAGEAAGPGPRAVPRPRTEDSQRAVPALVEQEAEEQGRHGQDKCLKVMVV